MSKTFKFELVSPERLLLSQEVVQVNVPGTEGRFGVLAGHSPLVSTIKTGVLEFVNAGGAWAKYYVRGGFAEVTAAGLTVLADKALDLSDLKGEVLTAELKHAEHALAHALNADAKVQAQINLETLKHFG